MTVTTREEQPPAAPPGPRWPPRWWRRLAALPRPLRLSTYAVGALVLVLVVGLLAAVVLVRRSFPQTEGTLDLPGLGAEVEVVRDDHGIPQVYADTTADLMYAEGFVHAQERFFDMDVRRHAAAGRLAELFGTDGLESDLYVRTLGWRRVAERELAILDPDTRAALDSYAAGVNAYLADRGASQLSVEYAALSARGVDYTPDPWTAVDSLTWLKAMAWDLRSNLDDEIDRSLSVGAVGEKRAARLFPAYDADGVAPIATQGRVVDGVYEQDATTGGTRNPTRPPPGFALDGGARRSLDGLGRLGRGTARMPAWLGRGDGLGSNSWVVAGEHTNTGRPLLADDPHLGVGLPGVWTQVGLHCRTVGPECPYDVSGFSVAGFPGVLIGHNAEIAWGFTNLAPDVTDLYVERVRGEEWRSGGRSVPLRTRSETIHVQGGPDVTIQVRSTAHGPIVSDVDDEVRRVAAGTADQRPARDGEEYAVALSWTALRPARTADSILALDRAADWDQFRDALSTFAAPAQNVVYADAQGHIGYQATGLVPIRKSGNDGRLPAAGWRPENDWTGKFVPYDGLPSVLDPDEGFVVAANQAVAGPDYPYYLTSDWDPGYRAGRIRALLTDRFAAGGTVSAGDLAALQLDTRTPLADVLVPYLRDVTLPDGYFSDGQALLADWDGTQPADGPQSAAAAYVNATWRQLLRLTFDDELPEGVRPDGGARWVAVVAGLLAHPRDRFWDDAATEDVRETRDDVLAEAQRDARDELTARSAVRAPEWTWGSVHRLELQSPVPGHWADGLVSRALDRGEWRVPGSGLSVDATGWDAREGYAVTTAPSMRMVVSPGAWDDARWVDLTGVSGHAFHPHYTDQTDLLVAGRTLSWPFSSDAVHASAEHTLTLRPAPDR